MYANPPYSVHATLNRRDRCRNRSFFALNLEILVASADKVFSNVSADVDSFCVHTSY